MIQIKKIKKKLKMIYNERKDRRRFPNDCTNIIHLMTLDTVLRMS